MAWNASSLPISSSHFPSWMSVATDKCSNHRHGPYIARQLSSPGLCSTAGRVLPSPGSRSRYPRTFQTRQLLLFSGLSAAHLLGAQSPSLAAGHVIFPVHSPSDPSTFPSLSSCTDHNQTLPNFPSSFPPAQKPIQTPEDDDRRCDQRRQAVAAARASIVMHPSAGALQHPFDFPNLPPRRACCLHLKVIRMNVFFLEKLAKWWCYRGWSQRLGDGLRSRQIPPVPFWTFLLQIQRTFQTLSPPHSTSPPPNIPSFICRASSTLVQIPRRIDGVLAHRTMGGVPSCQYDISFSDACSLHDRLYKERTDVYSYHDTQ